MTPKFTTSCFIRRNTPELRNKLKALGYSICPCAEFEDSIWLNNYPPNCNIHGVGFFDKEHTMGMPTTQEGAIALFLAETNDIDCGENERLFLSLAALREDSDRKQWFCDDNGLWEKCESELPSRYMQMHGHKATADEIVSKFSL